MKREVHRKMKGLIIVALTITCAAVANAQQDTGMERCAALDSDAERLACFDALTRRPDGPASAPVSSERPPGSIDSAEVERVEPPATDSRVSSQGSEMRPEVAAAEPMPDARATTETEDTVDAVTSSPQQDEPRKDEPERPKEYTATVVAMRERPRGQMAVSLDNGETWSEQYASRRFLVEVGDTVTMKKGFLSSSYSLIAPGGSSYKMTLIDP